MAGVGPIAIKRWLGVSDAMGARGFRRGAAAAPAFNCRARTQAAVGCSVCTAARGFGLRASARFKSKRESKISRNVQGAPLAKAGRCALHKHTCAPQSA